MLKKTLETFLDVVFPPSEIEILLREIPVERIFSRCAKSFDVPESDFYSIFKYKDFFIKNSIFELKNNKNMYAIQKFSDLLLEEILNYLEEYLIATDYKIPITHVPQHKKTYRDKGYNQSAEIAKHLRQAAPHIFTNQDLLIKTKVTKPQHEIQNKRDRFKNLKGAFEVRKEKKDYIKNKIIILVDDVATTGATLKEGRQKLLASGAQKVICFTIAH